MIINHHDNEKNGAFVAEEEGQEMGSMTYVWAGSDRFIIDHTEVGEAFGGRGVGRELLLAAVDFARQEKKKILPLCPFAKAQIQKAPELHDVL